MELVERFDHIVRQRIVHQQVRLILLIFVDIYIGVLTFIPPIYQGLQHTFLHQIPGGVPGYASGYLVSGALLILGKIIGPRTLRIAHAINAGFFSSVCTLVIVAWFIYGPAVTLSLPYEILMVWLHMRSAISLQEPVRRAHQA
jgi:hypothetical protein